MGAPYIHKIKLGGTNCYPRKGSDYMAVTVDDLKNSLRIEITDDDKMLETYIDTAKDYVTNAVNKNADLTAYRQFDFAVSLLAQLFKS